MAADLRFKDTWRRQRLDLKDSSQSGYDLALANFGLDAGLKPQQIVDLIVHHRRVHAQKARTKIDYYVRSISAAMHREGAADTMAASAQHADPTQDQDQYQTAAPDPENQKALLCERVSKVLGVKILRFVKIRPRPDVPHESRGRQRY